MSKQDNEYDVLVANVSAVMETTQGKAVVWKILAMCGLYADNLTEYYAGKRAVGLEILQLLEDTDPTIYPNLLLQNIEDFKDE